MSILFPPRCFGCAKNEEALCVSCLEHARKTLSVPYPYIVSFFSFKEEMVKRAIHAIKYYHRRDIIVPMVRAIVPEVRKIPNLEAYTLVPVPMPSLRKLFRGYNQAELIAIALGKELLLPVRLDILKRKHSLKRQVRAATRSERIHNQKGSFLVENNPIGMRLILVDDVTTTGATLDEARRALLAKRAANVLAVTLAH